MTEQVSLDQAHARLEDLAQRAARSGARVTITDHGEPAAVLISPRELADLDEAVALADYRAQQAVGAVRTIPHEQVHAHLELPQQ